MYQKTQWKGSEPMMDFAVIFCKYRYIRFQDFWQKSSKSLIPFWLQVPKTQQRPLNSSGNSFRNRFFSIFVNPVRRGQKSCRVFCPTFAIGGTENPAGLVDSADWVDLRRPHLVWMEAGSALHLHHPSFLRLASTLPAWASSLSTDRAINRGFWSSSPPLTHCWPSPSTC